MFNSEAHATWRLILTQHQKARSQQVVSNFEKGLQQLGIVAASIPDIGDVNQRLRALTNFEGVFVQGLEEGKSFFALLAERKFPIGNFVRDAKDLSYTPAPDVVHDLYGHLPFFADLEYADFCQKFAEKALEFANEPELFRQFERFFWFTIEFALIKTPQGMRIFGAGIASSTGECAYALSGTPQLIPFDVETIRKTEFRIDEMQKRLFVLESERQLYDSLDELYEKVKQDRKAKLGAL